MAGAHQLAFKKILQIQLTERCHQIFVLAFSVITNGSQYLKIQQGRELGTY